MRASFGVLHEQVSATLERSLASPVTRWHFITLLHIKRTRAARENAHPARAELSRCDRTRDRQRRNRQRPSGTARRSVFEKSTSGFWGNRGWAGRDCSPRSRRPCGWSIIDPKLWPRGSAAVTTLDPPTGRAIADAGVMADGRRSQCLSRRPILAKAQPSIEPAPAKGQGLSRTDAALDCKIFGQTDESGPPPGLRK
jgi:hypothetical protein